MSQLYRQSVIDAQKQRLHGDVLLAQPLSIYLIVAILFISVSLLVLFLNNAEYSRKETVQGYILPDKGVIRSFSQREGIVKTVHVSEGQEVEKGHPLCTISSKSKLENGLDLNQTVVREYEKQYQYINKEIEYQNSLHDQQISKQRLLAADIERQLATVDSQKLLIKKNISFSLNEKHSIKSFTGKGISPHWIFNLKREALSEPGRKG